MSIKEKISALSRNPLFSNVLGGLLVLAITALVAAIVAAYLRPTEIVNLLNLEEGLRNAKREVKATGYVLHLLSPDYMRERMNQYRSFNATMVVVDPLKDVICQRQKDEDNKSDNYGKTLSNLREFRQKCKEFFGGRLKLQVIDAYPTMTVMIIDDDLYVYFHPYGALGTDSPVLKFRNYKNDERATFFETHLNNIISRSIDISLGDKFKPYETADLEKNPCPKK